MSYTFAPEPRPPLLSKNTSTSSTMHSRRDGTRYSPANAESMSKSVMHTAPAYGYRPPSASSPHSLPEHGYRIQPQSFSVQTYRITEAEDKGEDSDYYHESTPGRAWKETKQATPRMRVVGFNVTTAHTPKSGANDDPVPCQPRRMLGNNDNDPHTPIHSHPGTSRRGGSAPDRSEIFYGQSLHAAADKPHVSRIHASAVPRRRSDTCKQQSITTSAGSDLRRKTLTKAS